jgi:hypothetical protein
MTTIYVDDSALLEPGAADRLRHLAEAGHELVLVGLEARPPGGTQPWAGYQAALPDEPARGSWFVTADPTTCLDYRAGLRTILVGPRAEAQRPTRCDTTARDLREAVLEILASDAMR